MDDKQLIGGAIAWGFIAIYFIAWLASIIWAFGDTTLAAWNQAKKYRASPRRGGGGFQVQAGGSGKGQGAGTILEETRALVKASQVFTVSVLIFVGLVIHGSMVRLARIL